MKDLGKPFAAESARDPYVYVGAVIIVVVVLFAYANSLSAGFVFDDQPGIVLNTSIRDPGNLAAIFSPPPEAAGAGGRPLVNLTLALNYAVGGLDPHGYHFVNLCIHVLAALTLFGLVRRTLAAGSREGSPRDTWRERFGVAALPLALCVALLWAVHPLLTESVTFAIQRNESLAGLFYLLTLYCFARSAQAAKPAAATGWRAAMLVACVLGVLTKEVMVTAPLVVLLYDRTFVSGTFREAWRRHARWFLALAGTWVILAFLVVHASKRGGTVGFGLGVSSWHYLLTQCHAITRYLWLSLWPHPLVGDYGTSVETSLLAVLPQALLLVALAVATIVALRARPVLGFLGAWFFVILAPSSSVVPLTTQTMAEHRMYLPLLAILVPLVFALYRWMGARAYVVILVLAIACGVLTARRNEDYRSEISFWHDAATKRPDNYRAHYDLGHALLTAGAVKESTDEFRAAIRLDPKKADPHYNLGNALVRLGDFPGAAKEFEETIRVSPESFDAHTNLGNVFSQLGRVPEAIDHYRAALRIKPDLVPAMTGIGNASIKLGRFDDALESFRAALRLQPDDPAMHYNMGNAFFYAKRYEEAVGEYSTAVRLAPGFAAAQKNLEIARSYLTPRAR